MSTATMDTMAAMLVIMMTTYVLWSIFGSLLRHLRVFLQPRQPDETWLEFFQRAWAAFLQKQADEQARQHAEHERILTRYGSRRKTMAIHWLNPVLLFGALYLIAYVPGSLGWVIGYVAVGLVVNAGLGVVRFEGLPPLDRTDRRVLRLFYAWFWPLYLWAWWDARRQRG